MASVKKIGTHWIADFQGVSPRRLRNSRKLMSLLQVSTKKAGFNIIKSSGSHQFAGGGKGVTGFVLLAQSHASFHSYPEFSYMALDVYSCGSQDVAIIIQAFEKYLKPKQLKIRRIRRR